jgi:hypothetical protein
MLFFGQKKIITYRILDARRRLGIFIRNFRRAASRLQICSQSAKILCRNPTGVTITHLYLLRNCLGLEFWPTTLSGAIHLLIIHNLIRVHVPKCIVQTLVPILRKLSRRVLGFRAEKSDLGVHQAPTVDRVLLIQLCNKFKLFFYYQVNKKFTR